VVVALTAPIGLGLAALAPEAVAVLYGPRYEAVAPELAVLSVFTVVYSVTFHSGDVYKALGRPGLLTMINVGKFVVLAPATWFLAPFGILAVALTVLGVELVHCLARLILLRSIIGLGVARQLRRVAGPLGAGVVMAMAVWALRPLLGDTTLILRIPLLVVLGLGLYAASIRLMAPDLYKDARSALARGRRSRFSDRSTSRAEREM
jgi:PST family polysaccharide transporter